MLSYILIFCIGLVLISPFSRNARKMLGGVFTFIFAIVFGWIFFIAALGLLSCWIGTTCHIMN
jgi:hypothetical protein